MTIPSICPVDAFLKIIGQRWSSYILWVLVQKGPIRFGALKREIPAISQKVLTEKLRELEKSGLIHRDYEPTIPPTVTYSLTHLAQDLIPLLESINQIAHSWREQGYL